MGGVAVLHPQDCLKDHRHKFNSTPMRYRRTVNFNPNYTKPPNFTLSDRRKRTPPKGILKKNDRKTEVKILKRGEALNESSTILKDVNDRKVSNGAASTPEEVSEVPISGRRVLPRKTKAEKDQNRIWNSSTEVEVSKAEDLAVSSTDRLQTEKNMTEFFAGSVFADSPPPSSVPLPGFFTKKFVAAVTDDATADLRRILGLSLS